jgi:hypothetical protein
MPLGGFRGERSVVGRAVGGEDVLVDEPPRTAVDVDDVADTKLPVAAVEIHPFALLCGGRTVDEYERVNRHGDESIYRAESVKRADCHNPASRRWRDRQRELVAEALEARRREHVERLRSQTRSLRGT